MKRRPFTWRKPVLRGKRLCARWECPDPPSPGSAYCGAHEPQVRRGY